MKQIGTLDGVVIVAVDARELRMLGLIERALEQCILNVTGSTDKTDKTYAPPSFPDPQDLVGRARLTEYQDKPAPRKRAAHGHPRKAAVCKVCGADRATTPWPKGGALCRECTRKKGLEAYYAKKGQKGLKGPCSAREATQGKQNGFRAAIGRDATMGAAAKAKKDGITTKGTKSTKAAAKGKPLSGPERIKAALERVESRLEADPRPHVGGRVLPLLGD